MTDTPQTPGAWQATDGKWYPPERHPDYMPLLLPVTPSVARAPAPTAALATTQMPPPLKVPAKASGSGRRFKLPDGRRSDANPAGTPLVPSLPQSLGSEYDLHRRRDIIIGAMLVIAILVLLLIASTH